MSWIWLWACAGTTGLDTAESAAPCTGVIEGTVYRQDEDFPEPEAGATVTAVGEEELSVRTEANGSYLLELPVGDWVLRASADGGACAAGDEPLVSLTCEEVEVDLTLDRCVRR